MSDHAWIVENLAAYLTDGLESAERERLEQHTAECAACAAALSAARAADAALTGLFVEARPSANLEDRLIQTLRMRSEAWRVPIPMWLALVPAALVLIGFTGALASQILVHGGLSLDVPTGSTASLGEKHSSSPLPDVDELALSSRRSVLSQMGLAGEESPIAERAGYEGRFPPALSSIDAETKGRYGPAKEKNSPEVPPSAPGTGGDMGGDSKNGVMIGNGSVRGGGMGGGMMGMGGGMSMMGGMPGGGSGSGAAMPSDGTSNSIMWGAASSTATPTSAYINAARAQGVFQPSKVWDTLSPGTEPTSNHKPEPGQPISKETGKDQKVIAKQPDDKPPQQAQPPGPRKIVIRSGDVEYEVQSFDAAVATITRLMKPIKGGFIATVNSDKLANGKVRGTVVVRVPPENLDELIVELRTNLGKSGELKNQRIKSLDISKQYTDLESELRAARAMEERLLQIIKTGKGEIKDLLAAEKELGNWRTRIEKIEGELRYYANQVALSTLTITLYEKEIQAPYGIVEREQVQMGIEVEEVDQAYQAAQKAVREAKGRITRAELQQPFQGQFSARLDFEVSPDVAGPLRDRLKQLGTVARFDISRLEETEGGTGKPTDGKTRRNDTRFQVSFYNLTNVLPRETVQINLACLDVEAALKTVLARVEKAAGRVVSSNLSSSRGDQTQAILQFEVKSADADAVLEDVKAAGEVMRLSVAESTDRQNTTRKKRGFHVQLLALSAAAVRETDEIQLACTDVSASYRGVLEAVAKIKGRVRNAQLNEQDRRKVTATLDVEVRRVDEAVLRAATATAGDIYTRKVSRAADADNVVDSKVLWKIAFINQSAIPPRETYVFGVEVADVDQTAAMLSALAGERQGRTVEANVFRERNGRVTGKLIYDVPMAKVHELIDQLRSTGTVRVQQSVKHPEIPDSPLAIARLNVTLSNKELIVPTDEGLGTSVRGGLADSFKMLAWSLRILIFGLCILLPWAMVLVLVVWTIYRLVVRMRRTTPAAPAA